LTPTATRGSQPRSRVLDFYRSAGYLVVEDALDSAEISAFQEESVRVCKGRGDEMPELRGLAALPDDDALRKVLCVHFPHKLSATFQEALRQPRIVDFLTAMIGPDVKAVQSMLFIKAAGKPGQAWHQDEYFIPSRDRSLTGVWIALDDATVDNGCLWVVPGSHQPGVLYPERQTEDSRFDCTTEAYAFPRGTVGAVPVEVPAGAAVFFNGYLLHRSLPNVTTSGYRRALVNHYMSAQSLLPWRPLRAGEHIGMLDCRDVELVAGRDPYADAGVEDYHRPHVRPDREGGCDKGV
jgi:phytanoyl-CoA hydroxylase